MVACINSADCGKANQNPRPAEGGAPNKAGGHGGGGGVGHVGGWERATMENILFWNARESDDRLPVITLGARANLANSFHCFERAGSIEKVFEGIADEGITNGDTEESEDDPCFGAVFSPNQEDAGSQQEDRGPESAIGEEVKKEIEQGMVESAVDPAENCEVQRINLGDQGGQVKLVKMERQAVCVVLFFLLTTSGWAQERSKTAATSGEERLANGAPAHPTPHQMQNFLWRTLVMKDLTLKGQVQSGSRKIPVVVRTRDRLLQFEFQDRPLQIRVRFAPEGSLVQSRAKSDGVWEVITGAEKTKSVVGTDLAYEDLGIDFLRWPDPKQTGEDSVMMLDCWVYEVAPPVASNYAKVRYWISKSYLSMIRADGLNAQGQAIKRFTFNSVIEAEDTVVIGEMKVAKLTPGTDVSASRTYVQIETVEKGSGL